MYGKQKPNEVSRSEKNEGQNEITSCTFVGSQGSVCSMLKNRDTEISVTGKTDSVDKEKKRKKKKRENWDSLLK